MNQISNSDGTNILKKVKDQIEAIIEQLGEEQDKSSIKSKKSTSSSSSEHGTENDEADTGNGLKFEFQRRKSSYSSIESSTLNLQECIDIEEPVFTINSANQPTLPEGMCVLNYSGFNLVF